MPVINELELEKYDNFINTDEKYSQILLGFNETDKPFKKVKKLIEESGVSILKAEILSPVEDQFKFTLIKLNTRDMRNIVLRLIEEGFTIIKGCNARE